ncbi:hypothetical protein ACU686_21800 [Yinghuangia aomiensis]
MTSTTDDPAAAPPPKPRRTRSCPPWPTRPSSATPTPPTPRLRRDRPVHRTPHGVWYVSRHADIETALADLRLSNDRDRMTSALFARDGGLRALSRLTERLGRVMTDTDPPDRVRLRGLVNKAFTARRVEQLRDRIQQITDDLLDALQTRGGAADYIADVAERLPITVVCALFGIPDADQRPSRRLVPRPRRHHRRHRPRRSRRHRVRGLPRQPRPRPPRRHRRRHHQRPHRRPSPRRPSHRRRTPVHLLHARDRGRPDHHPPPRQRPLGAAPQSAPTRPAPRNP